MSEALDVMAEALRRVEARERVVLVTILSTRGSTPRKAGARMLVGREGLVAGTVGGGRFEQEVLGRAAGVMEKGGFLIDRVLLTQGLGQCCGGEMEFSVERLRPPERLFVFGAGHVSEQLVPIAARAGFSVTVLDERPELLTRERFPDAARLLDVIDPIDWGSRVALDADAWCVIMTHDHPLDQRILQRLLNHDLPYIGLIGSLTKIRKFRLRLETAGVPAEKLDRVHAPIGLDIGAETPAEIAVSIAAELVRVRRGMGLDAGRAGDAEETEEEGPAVRDAGRGALRLDPAARDPRSRQARD